jgi:uncharacterized protein YuzB (UPF0349 family)
MVGTVEYCLQNVDPTVRRTLRRVEGCETVEKRCLQRCGRCRRGPLLVADGRPVTGGDHRALLSELGVLDG